MYQTFHLGRSTHLPKSRCVIEMVEELLINIFDVYFYNCCYHNVLLLDHQFRANGFEAIVSLLDHGTLLRIKFSFNKVY